MSTLVGLVFTTTLPIYVTGFRCAAPRGAGPRAVWWLANARSVTRRCGEETRDA
jgi:hypothetical protein